MNENFKLNASLFEKNNSSGERIEKETVGRIKGADKDEAFEKYIKYSDAMKAVKKPDVQPFEDPSEPSEVPFANDLLSTVADKLNLEDYSDLRFYTAVGSQLDIHHGVDAFFEFDVDGKIVVVTLDVTINESKIDNAKADVVIFMPRDGLDPKLKEDREDYFKKLDEVSSDIIKVINRKVDILMAA